MTKEFKLQDPGEGIHEAEILDVYVKDGDEVEEGQDLFAVETDKAAVDIPSPFSGTVEQIKVEVGDMARVGDVLLTYQAAQEAEERADESGDREEKEGDQDDEAATGDKGDDEHDGRSEAQSSMTEEESSDKEERDKSKQSASEEESRDDEARAESEQSAQDEENAVAQQAEREGERVAAAPATRRLARELGVDLGSVEGSGPEGRVEEEDVRRSAEGSSESTGEERAGRVALPDFEQWGEIEARELRGIRRHISEKMQLAWREIPHVMHSDFVDVTELEAFRRAHEADFEGEDGKLTLTVFVLKAVASALSDFPRFNASLDAQNQILILKHYIHIGVATDTEAGLLVPVIRHVDQKSLAELTAELFMLSERARGGDLTPEEMQGGSITVTNPGGIGASIFTPIINHPEVAIIGLGTARMEPVVRESADKYEIEPRFRLPLMIGFDHRVNDGADAARFARRIADLLASPEAFLLHAA